MGMAKKLLKGEIEDKEDPLHRAFLKIFTLTLNYLISDILSLHFYETILY